MSRFTSSTFQAWAVRLSEQAYGLLLHAYPGAHRLRYGRLLQQAFRDLCREATKEDGPAGVLQVWGRVLPDLASTALAERMSLVRQTSSTTLVLGAALLAIPALFVTVNVMAYELGFEFILRPYEAFTSRPGIQTWWPLIEALVILGGPAAAGLQAVRLFQAFRKERTAQGSALALVLRKRAGSVVVLAGALLIMSILFTYGIVENWACLIGAQVSC